MLRVTRLFWLTERLATNGARAGRRCVRASGVIASAATGAPRLSASARGHTGNGLIFGVGIVRSNRRFALSSLLSAFVQKFAKTIAEFKRQMRCFSSFGTEQEDPRLQRGSFRQFPLPLCVDIATMAVFRWRLLSVSAPAAHRSCRQSSRNQQPGARRARKAEI